MILFNFYNKNKASLHINNLCVSLSLTYINCTTCNNCWCINI